MIRRIGEGFRVLCLEMTVNYRDFLAGVAQLVEQLTRNEKVGGSIPLSGTIL